MNIVLIGIPGSGKSTQGNMLSARLGIPYLSSGHIFRKLSREKSPTGRYVKETLHAGKLIPDERAIAIVEEYLGRPEYKNGFILDGFPRTLAQAKKFSHEINAVIYLSLDDKDALWRIAFRLDARDDQEAATVVHRIELFHETTDPVVEYYRSAGLVMEVDASGTIDSIHEMVLRALGSTGIHKKLEKWKPSKRIIIAMTGLAGSGKSFAAGYLASIYAVPVVHLGAIVNEEVARMNLSNTEEHHKRIREDMRKKHGMHAIALLSKAHIDEALKNAHVVVIDDMRSFEEYTYLKEAYPEHRVVIVALWAPKETRYARVSKRAEFSHLTGVERDLDEIIGANQGATIAFADYLIDNSGDKDECERNIASVYRSIYYELIS